ncbi:MAG: hypothetical protein SVG88_05565 [Halobacteriales archaeon]|nr:hypothetical protein [Halobacteriales archaeon]
MATCSTHARAFVDHSIDDGTDLIARTYYALAATGDRTPEPSPVYADRIANAFRKAFIQSADVPLVPEPVDAAIEEASDLLVHRILDNPDADLRTELLPAFYRTVARTYCAYLEAGGEPGEVGIWYDQDDDDGGIPVEP